MTSGAQDFSQVNSDQIQPNQVIGAGQGPVAPDGIGGIVNRPSYSVRRVLCGLWWALGTALCTISALISLFGGHFLQFLGAAAIAGLIGWYDYRIWTFKAKWLMFLIIF